MPNKRKYISTEYGMVNLRDGDKILHLDAEILADIYWRVFDGELTEVVRCKDCKYRRVNEHYGEKGYMKLKAMCDLDTGDPFELGRYAENDDWYCADGERREDGKVL